MPSIPIYTTDENNVPLNDLELYINDVLVDPDFDYGESYNFPCGEDFKLNLRRRLWYGANEVICHNNPVISNNDISYPVTGFSSGPFPCQIPSDPHSPVSSITVTINTNVYTLTYPSYTPTVNEMLTDVAIFINNDTPTTFWEAIVEGDCLRIRKTQYTANSYNGQTFTITIHREFPATLVIVPLGATGNTVLDPCDPFSVIEQDEYRYDVIWREVHEDFTQTLTVDTDDEVPFEFENVLFIPCCNSWSINNNDDDGILEAGELNPMYIVLATPDFDGAISNFWLVKYPCSNKVCAYEMTNIPYCYYEYDYNVTPESDESTILTGRNTCYTYSCEDIYTVSLRVIRCSEELREFLNFCGCGIRDAVDYNWIEDISYQQVETDSFEPDILELDIDRPAVCEQLCQDCNTYCKSYCYQERDVININYANDYFCCNAVFLSDTSLWVSPATLNVYDNGVLIHSVNVLGRYVGTFDIEWNTTGLHEIELEAITCCGTYKKKYKIYVIPCKPYDLDFHWTLDCDCNVYGGNENVRECNCVPVGEEVLFTPQYTVPDCGCPLVCETITPDPISEDVFTEQTNGTQLSATNYSTYITAPSSFALDGLYLVSPIYAYPSLFASIPLTTIEHLGNTGVGVRLQANTNTFLPTPFRLPLFLYYFFQNNYNYPSISSATLSFNLWFRYENTPGVGYPIWAMKPNFPFKFVIPNGVDTSNNPQPYTSAYDVTFLGSSSQFNGSPSVPFINPAGTPPNHNSSFNDPSTPYYRFQINFGAGSLNLSGIRLEMELDNNIFYNNQYIVDLLISDVDLVVDVPATPYERCYKEHTVRWYVDDIRVKEIPMTSPNYNVLDDRLEYAFNEKGCHKVKLEVENCAGACNVEKEVCVGDSITLTKQDCYEWVITDCKRYKKCYDDVAVPNELCCPVNITELNIVNLPVNQEWIQLEPSTVYYDKKENKWLYYWNAPYNAIILYSDLYNNTLPHAQYIWILYDYPYMSNIVTGEVVWVCEKYKAIVYLYDINNNLLSGYPYEVLYYNGENIHIPLQKDGIYKLKIKVYSIRPLQYGLPENQTTIIEELECEYDWYIIELCGIYKCYETLFHKLQCATDCECPNEKEIAKLRQEINLFMAFFNLLNISVEAEFSMYSTMSSIIMDSQRISNANTINEQLEALIKLCNKCGCACQTDAIKKPSCSTRILTSNTNINISKGGGCGCNK